MQSKIAGVLQDGIRHVKLNQQDDGSFESLSSFLPDDFSDATSYKTTFFASTILSCLNSLDENHDELRDVAKDIAGVKHAAAQFLLAEKSPAWSWNYWAHDAPECVTMPYPDDLDDTFAALAALTRHDPRMIDGAAMASVAKILTKFEIQEGGPYRTWLVHAPNDPARNDVDPVANSTAAHFLSLFDVTLPNVQNFLSGAIETNRLASPYYPGTCHVAYFMSRACMGETKQALAKIILAYLAQPDANTTMLENAMAISSLVNLGSADRIAPHHVGRLVSAIQDNGWRPHAFCIDPARGGKKSYGGSSALTAAFCVEALFKYSAAAGQRLPPSRSGVTRASRAGFFFERIIRVARDECSSAGNDVRKILHGELDALTDKEVVLIARDFHESLGERGKTIQENVIDELCLANLYGWLSYSIYDDFFDDEGDPLLLSAAMLFARKLSEHYASIDHAIPGAWDLFKTITDAADNANAWEQAHCRIAFGQRDHFSKQLPSFGNYGTLAERSMGHALGPLVQLVAIGYGSDSNEFASVASLFRHYLIARQLHDDAHDWADDLLRGRVNSVATLIIKQYPHDYDATAITQHLPALRHLFWTEIINDVTRTIISHITAAREARRTSSVFTGATFLEPTLASLEHNAKKALEERDATLQFLKAYRETPIVSVTEA